jgi:hypothetical protein
MITVAWMLLTAPSCVAPGFRNLFKKKNRISPSENQNRGRRDAIVPGDESDVHLKLMVHLSAIDLLSGMVKYYVSNEAAKLNRDTKKLATATIICGVAATALGIPALIFATAGLAALPIAVTAVAVSASGTGTLTGFLGMVLKKKRDQVAHPRLRKTKFPDAHALKKVGAKGVGTTGAATGLKQTTVRLVSDGSAAAGLIAAPAISVAGGVGMIGKGVWDFKETNDFKGKSEREAKEVFDFDFFDNAIDTLRDSGISVGIPEGEQNWLQVGAYLESFLGPLEELQYDYSPPLGSSAVHGMSEDKVEYNKELTSRIKHTIEGAKKGIGIILRMQESAKKKSAKEESAKRESAKKAEKKSANRRKKAGDIDPQNCDVIRCVHGAECNCEHQRTPKKLAWS